MRLGAAESFSIRPTPHGLANITACTMVIGALTSWNASEFERAVQVVGMLIALGMLWFGRPYIQQIGTLQWWILPAGIGWLVVRLFLDGMLKGSVQFETWMTVVILTVFSAGLFDFVVALAIMAGALLSVVLLALHLGHFNFQTVNYVAYTAAAALYMSHFSRQLQLSEERAEEAERLVQRDDETGLFQGAAGIAQLERLMEGTDIGPVRVGLVLLQPQGIANLQREFGYSSVQHLKQSIAVRLIQNCNPKDVVCVWREGEFLVGLWNVCRAELKDREEHLCNEISGVFWSGGPVVKVHAASEMIISEGEILERVAMLEEELAHKRES